MRSRLRCRKKGRPFIVAKDMPADQVAALRTAFEQASANPDLLAEARRAALLIDVVKGARAEQLVADLYATPSECTSAHATDPPSKLRAV